MDREQRIREIIAISLGVEVDKLTPDAKICRRLRRWFPWRCRAYLWAFEEEFNIEIF